MYRHSCNSCDVSRSVVTKWHQIGPPCCFFTKDSKTIRNVDSTFTTSERSRKRMDKLGQTQPKEWKRKKTIRLPGLHVQIALTSQRLPWSVYIHPPWLFLSGTCPRKEGTCPGKKTKPRDKILLSSCIQLSLLSNSLQKLGIQTGGHPRANFHNNKWLVSGWRKCSIMRKVQLFHESLTNRANWIRMSRNLRHFIPIIVVKV